MGFEANKKQYYRCQYHPTKQDPVHAPHKVPVPPPGNTVVEDATIHVGETPGLIDITNIELPFKQELPHEDGTNHPDSASEPDAKPPVETDAPTESAPNRLRLWLMDEDASFPYVITAHAGATLRSNHPS